MERLFKGKKCENALYFRYNIYTNCIFDLNGDREATPEENLMLQKRMLYFNENGIELKISDGIEILKC